MGTGGRTCDSGGGCEAGEELRGWQREKFGVVCVHLDRSDHVKIP